MLIKTLLNKVERFKSFVYDSVQSVTVAGNEALIIIIIIKPRSKSKPRCHEWAKRCLAII